MKIPIPTITIYPFNGCIVFHCLERQLNNFPSPDICAMRLFWPSAIKQSHMNILEYMPICVVQSVRNNQEMKVLDSGHTQLQTTLNYQE